MNIRICFNTYVWKWRIHVAIYLTYIFREVTVILPLEECDLTLEKFSHIDWWEAKLSFLSSQFSYPAEDWTVHIEAQ